MGTYYTLGIIRKFEARATKGKNPRWLDEKIVPLKRNEWIKTLSDRIDPYLFDLVVQEDGSIRAELKNEIFQQHINSFYDVLRNILGEKRNENIDYYEKSYCMHKKDIYGKDGDVDDNDYYSIEGARPIHIIDKAGNGIFLKCDFIMLMLEGKVLEEEFYTDPVLINYLFRHSNIDNPLRGAVISEVVG
jgi:hypothetical protein